MSLIFKRNLFLGFSGIVAIAVGLTALLFPEMFLAQKGVAPIAATVLWMRETGLLLLAIGLIAFAVRRLPPSPFLRQLFVVNLIIQLGLLGLEAFAFASGTIQGWASIVPNGLLHLLLIAGFLYMGISASEKPGSVQSDSHQGRR